MIWDLFLFLRLIVITFIFVIIFGSVTVHSLLSVLRLMLSLCQNRVSVKNQTGIYHYHHRGAGGIRAPPGQVSLQYNANYSMFLAASSLSNSAFPGKIREEESQLLRAQFTKDNPFLEQHYEDPA